MALEGYAVRPVERSEIKDLIETWHYSRSINGLMSSYCFGLYDSENTLVGGMIYGGLGMANAWKKYADSPEDVVELRRLACVDDTPRNAESFFIGATLRWLRKNTTVKTVVSYADANQGHEGGIYKATNFTHVGMTPPGRIILFEGRKYHDKAIRTKYKGELKPFAKRLKDALDRGDAHYEKQLPKHTYVKELR